MNLPIEKLEEDLSQICGRQADLYETALGISNHLAEKFLGGEDADPSLQQLNSLLNEIGGLNQLAGETRQRWEAQRRVPGRQLSSVLSRLEAAIRRLIDNLAQAEEYARQARQRLAPELDREAVGRQMRQAYAASSRAETV